MKMKEEHKYVLSLTKEEVHLLNSEIRSLPELRGAPTVEKLFDLLEKW